MVPTIKVTLQHNSGAISSYKPSAPLGEPGAGALREAIITCIAGAPGDLYNRVELLRSDMAGADWSALVRARAVPELEKRLKQAALDLSDGTEPHIVVTLDASRAITNARLVTGGGELAEQLKNPANRAMVVPRILPYQLGGSAEGASAVLYSPEGGKGIKVFSIHPNAGEAKVSEANLRNKGETVTTVINVQTAVTALVAAVADGNFKPELSAASSNGAIIKESLDHTRLHRPGGPTPLSGRMGAPSPFSA